jgi:hypothetical protein
METLPPPPRQRNNGNHPISRWTFPQLLIIVVGIATVLLLVAGIVMPIYAPDQSSQVWMIIDKIITGVFDLLRIRNGGP